MPDELKPVLARQMEVYAGFLEHTDHHVGRLVDAIDDLGVLDNTLIYYIIGDNGASAEGTLNGAFNEMANFNGMAALETPEFMAEQDGRVRLARAPTTTTRSAGRGRWTRRSSGPSRWPRTGAAPATAPSCTGPNGIEEKGGLRTQFTHVIDVAPTILEAAGLPEPTMVNGVQQSPMEGTSMLYTFHEAEAPERHDLQYFEMFGNRGIYHKGLERGHQAPHAVGDGGQRCRPSTTTSGSSTTAAATTARPTTSRPSTRTCSPSCNGSGSSRRPSTTCSRLDDRHLERAQPDHRRPAPP